MSSLLKAKTGWALLAVALLALGGCQQKDGAAFARAGRKVGDKLEGLTGGARGNVAAALGAVRGAVGRAAADSRVQTRLRWDRDLADADLRARLARPGVVLLQGRVADVKQKRRALELARTTLGVEKVVDEVRVDPEG